MSEGNISEVFAGIVNLAKELGVKSIGKLEAPWEHRLDETWEFAVNGQNRSVKWRFTTLDAFSFIGLRNGFPVILGDPYGGTVMGTGPEVEDELIERLSAAIERERQTSKATAAILGTERGKR